MVTIELEIGPGVTHFFNIPNVEKGELKEGMWVELTSVRGIIHKIHNKVYTLATYNKQPVSEYDIFIPDNFEEHTHLSVYPIPIRQLTKSKTTMRTVIVTFPDNPKEYAFNLEECSNGYELREGDKIILPNYRDAIVTVKQVKSHLFWSLDYGRSCFYTTCRGDIPIKTTDWVPSCWSAKSWLTIEDARVLYEQGGEAKKIALRKYTEAQLKPEPKRVELTDTQKLRQMATQVLQEFANDLNKGWEKTHGTTGYFLSYNPYKNTWEVLCHTQVIYPGVVYFVSEEAARKAIQAMTPMQKKALRS